MFAFLSRLRRQSPAPHLAISLDPGRPTGTLAQPAPTAPQPSAEQDTPVISFKNIPHALATFFKAAAQKIKDDAPKVEAAIEKIEGDKQVVEAVSGVVATAIQPGSAAVVNVIEDAGFAALGALDNALKAGGAAAEQNLLNAGVDQAAIDAVKAVGVSSVAVYTLAKAAAK
jgi:hypothetical protein